MEEAQAQPEPARSKGDDDSLHEALKHLTLSTANVSSSHSSQLWTAFDTPREAFSALKASSLLSESDIFEFLIAIAKRHQYEEEVFYFEDEVRHIIRKVLADSHHLEETLWRIMERCHVESTSLAGQLGYDHYYYSFPDERSSANPYDPDYDAEQYNEHQDRLEVDEAYARVFKQRAEREQKEKEQRVDGWKSFWVQLIRVCPNGPTLFHPPLSRNVKCEIADIPRYLFRAFDGSSSGQNDEEVIASEQSVFGEAKLSRDDILSRDKNDAANMLCKHLNPSQKYHTLEPPYAKPPKSDNLVSWSSSMLFVVRRAISQRHLGKKNVKICVVDTRQYPDGQFLRDKSLLRAYEPVNPAAATFLSFRENRPDFDNGEYLSQGRLSHRDRSCVVSLEKLKSSGLCRLYPELWRKREGKWEGEWTNFVKDLREEWRRKCEVRLDEIKGAFNISRSCFAKFQDDMALVLLSFKNRGDEDIGTFLSFRTYTITNLPEDIMLGNLEIYGHYGPIEVQRYEKAARVMQRNASATPELPPIQRLASIYGIDKHKATTRDRGKISCV